MADLGGRAAIVTGGSSGIGLAIARALAADGARVAIAARGAERLEAAARELAGTGGEVLAVPADVTRADDVRALVGRAVERFGRLDILVNNAGVLVWKPIQRVRESDWDAAFQANLKSAFLCIQAVLPILKKQRSGYIINIASQTAKLPTMGLGPYSATKAGLLALGGALLDECLPYNIRVASICPGTVDTTAQIPFTRYSKLTSADMIPPADVAEAVRFLLRLSDRCAVPELVLGNVPRRSREAPPTA